MPVPRKNPNPFLELMAKGLSNSGWEPKPFHWKLLPLLKNRKTVSIIHVHWPNALWRSGSAIFSYLKAARFIYLSLISRFLGYKLVWSAHNVLPHEYRSKGFEISMRKWIVRNFHLVVGHAINCEEDLQDQLGVKPPNYVLATYGNYEDYYSYDINREDIRRQFGYRDEDRVICLLAGPRSNKGSGIFLEAWENFDSEKVKLLVLGKVEPEWTDRIKEMKNVKHDDRFLTGRDFVENLVVSDFIALPYRSITTSGAYHLALTFEKPVIASDISFFKAHSSSKTALLFNLSNFKKELGTILDSVENDWQPDYSQILELKNKFNWNDAGHEMASAFNDLIKDKN